MEQQSAHAVRERLRDLIAQLPENSKLPAERDLCRDLDTSRMTLRRAMDELVSEHWIVRRSRQGNFTRKPPIAGSLGVISFAQDMAMRGHTTTTSTVDFRQTRASRVLSRQLRIPHRDPVFVFQRLRAVSGTPVALEQTSVACSTVPGLTESDLDEGWFSLLERRGIRMAGASLSVAAVAPDRDTANLLRIAENCPCLQLRGPSVDGEERVIDNSVTIYRGDAFELAFELRDGLGRSRA